MFCPSLGGSCAPIGRLRIGGTKSGSPGLEDGLGDGFCWNGTARRRGCDSFCGGGEILISASPALEGIFASLLVVYWRMEGSFELREERAVVLRNWQLKQRPVWRIGVSDTRYIGMDDFHMLERAMGDRSTWAGREIEQINIVASSTSSASKIPERETRSHDNGIAHTPCSTLHCSFASTSPKILSVVKVSGGFPSARKFLACNR